MQYETETHYRSSIYSYKYGHTMQNIVPLPDFMYIFEHLIGQFFYIFWYFHFFGVFYGTKTHFSPQNMKSFKYNVIGFQNDADFLSIYYPVRMVYYTSRLRIRHVALLNRQNSFLLFGPKRAIFFKSPDRVPPPDTLGPPTVTNTKM